MSTETESNKKKSLEDKGVEKNKSSSGLEENIGGLVAYLVGFVSGVILLFMEKDNEFIRFHALQSAFTFGGLFVLIMVLSFIPIIGWIISLLLSPVSLFLWIFLMYKAYSGERYKLPYVGDMVEEQLNK